MKEEPDIIKELREAEKFGLLQSMIQSTFEDLEVPDESIEKTPGQTGHMIKDLEKKTNEHELGDIEEKYRTIFENYTVAITLADNKERIISWNKYTEELFNMTQNELYLKSVSSLYPPEEWQKIRSENVRQKGIKYRMETRMIRKNQGLFDVELSLCVLKGKEGKTVGSVGIIRDITRLKETERELKKSEERYQTIFENSAVAITLTDENERIISWNKYTENLLRIDKDDLYLKPVESLYPVEEWQKIRSENIRQRGLQHHMDTKMFKKNNEIIDVDLSLSVLKNHEGNVIGSIGVFQDITKRKLKDKALKESEHKFKQLYEKAPVSYHTLSPTGEITNVNEKWCQTLGYSKKEVIGRSIFDFITRAERKQAKSSFHKKIRDEKSYNGGHERKYITKDGKELVFLIHDFLSFAKDKKVISIHTTMENVTEQKNMENELKEAHKHLQTLNHELENKVRQRTAEVEKLLKQKDEFIVQLGHDLRTPLTPITALFPLVMKKPDDPSNRETLNIIHRNINCMKDVVFDTLKLAKLNSTSFELDFQYFNLSEIVSSIITDNKPYFEEKKVKVENLVDNRIFVEADDVQLKEVFNNLSINAVKFMKKNGNLTFDAKMSDDKKFVTVLVRDTGIGMTQEQSDQIFDEFYKSDQSRHDLGSSGLGLPICKRIIEKHGGRIWVESPGINKGSTFYFTLRLGKEKVKIKMKKKKIMFVDDNPDLLFTVKKGLERLSEGYEVIGVKSGKECFELLKNDQVPDIILLDIMMPEINGWDVFTKLKEKPEWKKIPIFFVTAKTDEYSRAFGKLTADDYIEKPFNIRELKLRIDKVLDG